MRQIALNFEMFDDEGWVYVNGQFVGESHDWNDGPTFGVRKFLHVGDIQLSASADGLAPATVVIHAEPGAGRPVLPDRTDSGSKP